jgi:glutamyl/glutaminyl-tRNA synthetase
VVLLQIGALCSLIVTVSRQNTTPHHRTGTTYKAYPTYDLACPIVDSLEGVSHALRTTEYVSSLANLCLLLSSSSYLMCIASTVLLVCQNDRDEQYGWIQKALSLRRVRIHAFSRVNFTNTVLSKRKLTWFVENGYVTGWDDARFPTVRGVVRRGVNITALRGFMYSQGASRRVVNMVWNTFWAENKKEIDKTAQRFMAIDAEEHTVLRITGAPKEENNAYTETSVHPKDPSLGTRVMRISDEVILESVDVDGIAEGENIVLLHWGTY